MIQTQTKELVGTELDWAVANYEGVLHDDGSVPDYYQPSVDWGQGGAILECERISIEWTGEDWMAYIKHDEEFFGETPLVAAMRCYVAAQSGQEEK